MARSSGKKAREDWSKQLFVKGKFGRHRLSVFFLLTKHFWKGICVDIDCHLTSPNMSWFMRSYPTPGSCAFCDGCKREGIYRFYHCAQCVSAKLQAGGDETFGFDLCEDCHKEGKLVSAHCASHPGHTFERVAPRPVDIINLDTITEEEKEARRSLLVTPTGLPKALRSDVPIKEDMCAVCRAKQAGAAPAHRKCTCKSGTTSQRSDGQLSSVHPFCLFPELPTLCNPGEKGVLDKAVMEYFNEDGRFDAAVLAEFGWIENLPCGEKWTEYEAEELMVPYLSVPMVEALLRRGMRINARDVKGRTALLIA